MFLAMPDYCLAATHFQTSMSAASIIICMSTRLEMTEQEGVNSGPLRFTLHLQQHADTH